MANTIKQKRGTTDPGASDLVVGELAINTTDGGVFTKTDGGTVVEVGGSGGATDIDGLSDAITNSSGATIGIGTGALANDDGTSNNNTAVGYQAANSVTGAIRNTAFGHRALYSATSSYNAAFGFYSLYQATTGQRNTCLGTYAGYYATTGSQNTFVGYIAGDSTTGSNNVCIGYDADPSSATVSNEITLGNSANNLLRIPGLQSGASNGDVLTYNSTSGGIELADVSATVASGAIYENSQSITASYTITTNKNAMSAGPIDIASGATVTVPSGSVWSIV